MLKLVLAFGLVSLVLCAANEHTPHTGDEGEAELLDVLNHHNAGAEDKSVNKKKDTSDRPHCVPSDQELPIYYNLKKPLLRDVERIPPPTAREFWENYITKNKPVIITGALTNWTAFHKWTDDDYLMEKYGDIEIHAELSNNNAFGYEVGKDWRQIEVTWKQALKQYRPGSGPNGGHLYISSEVPEEMDVDFSLPPFLPCHGVPDHHYTDTGLWMGGGGQNSLLHSDPSDNLLHVLDGRKQMILFPPEEGPLIYEKVPNSNVGDKGGLPKWKGEAKKRLLELAEFGERDSENFSSRVSPVDIENPDYRRYPKLQEAQGHLAEMQRGDVLYLPKLWYHQVYSYCRHLSINHWFDISRLNDIVLKKPELWTWPGGKIVRFLQQLDARRPPKCANLKSP